MKELSEELKEQVRFLEELVTEMRKHQKAYFRTRSSEELQLSKEFEKKVDEYIDSKRWVQTLF